MKNLFLNLLVFAVALSAVLVSCTGDENISVTGVELDETAVELVVGSTTTLSFSIAPDNATDKTVSWTSSNEAVATVTGGVVTAVAEGTATITVTTRDGGKTDVCTVTVEEATVAVTGVTLNKSELELRIDATETLVATVTPEDATNKNVTWTSNDEAVATVVDGVVTALAAGTAIITVTSEEGAHPASCTVTVPDPDVYVVGSVVDGGFRKAALWKNGELQILSHSIAQSAANAVWVSENDDVYVVGTDGGSDFVDRATLWVNGVAQTLGTGINPTYGNSVHGSGDDVYVVGHMLDYNTFENAALLWKNGEVQTLPGTGNTYAYGVFASGDDVYACGYSNFRVALWKNGEPQPMTYGDYYSESMSVFVADDNVYVAGDVSNDGYMATIWKNGQPTTICEDRSYVFSSFVSGDDVYIAGIIDETRPSNYDNKDRRAVVWKNGEAQILSNIQSQVGGVYVLGGSVYAAGRTNVEDRSASERAVLWKDGEEQTLSEVSSLARGIFVK